MWKSVGYEEMRWQTVWADRETEDLDGNGKSESLRSAKWTWMLQTARRWRGGVRRVK